MIKNTTTHSRTPATSMSGWGCNMRECFFSCIFFTLSVSTITATNPTKAAGIATAIMRLFCFVLGVVCVSDGGGVVVGVNITPYLKIEVNIFTTHMHARTHAHTHCTTHTTNYTPNAKHNNYITLLTHQTYN